MNPNNEAHIPVELLAFEESRIIELAIAPNGHVLALTETGRVYAWDRPAEAEAGIGDGSAPWHVLNISDTPIAGIAAGSSHVSLSYYIFFKFIINIQIY